VTSWITGDVYQWRLERADTWTNETTGEQRTEWEYVDSVCDYYGERAHKDMADDGFASIPAGDAQEVTA
jgi:hypothetical protein